MTYEEAKLFYNGTWNPKNTRQGRWDRALNDPNTKLTIPPGYASQLGTAMITAPSPAPTSPQHAPYFPDSSTSVLYPSSPPFLQISQEVPDNEDSYIEIDDNISEVDATDIDCAWDDTYDAVLETLRSSFGQDLTKREIYCGMKIYIAEMARRKIANGVASESIIDGLEEKLGHLLLQEARYSL